MLPAFVAAVEEWRDAVEFHCSFTYRAGWAASLEDGLAGRWGSKIGDAQAEDRITGMHNKQGERVRLAWDFGRAANETRHAGGVSRTNMSFDEVAVGPLGVVHHKRHGAGGDVVVVSTRLDAADAQYRAGAFDNALYLTPFSYGGGRELWLEPLKTFPQQVREKGGQFSCRMEVNDAEHVTFHVDGSMAIAGTTLQKNVRVTFWTKPPLPVIDRMQTVSREGDGPWRESATEFADFVKCGGGMMARRVRAVSGPWPVPANLTVAEWKARNTPWMAKEWISEDLGARDPNLTDFVLAVPPGVAVKGLRKPPPEGAAVSIDLSQLTVEDLDLGGSFVAGDGPPRGPAGRRVLLTLTCGLVMLIVAILVYMRQHTPKRNSAR